MEGIKVITQGVVNVHITRSGSEDAAPIERRFKKEITIQDFKTKLELLTGGSAATMKLKLYDNKNNHICDLDDDTAAIGSYPVDDGARIHVVDRFALVEDFDAADGAERFRLSEEEYERKGDTLRSFLQRNKLGKYNAEEAARLAERRKVELEREGARAAAAAVGARCEVRVPGAGARRATVRYNGPLAAARGLWIGVHYDEPLGRNDGSVNGERYFTCPPNYGGFVKPAHVTVGDFPEEDLGLEDEI